MAGIHLHTMGYPAKKTLPFFRLLYANEKESTLSYTYIHVLLLFTNAKTYSEAC